MIQCFGDEETEDIFNGVNSKSARKKLSPSLHPIARRKLDMLDSAIDINDLRIPPSNRLELLKGNFKGRYSIRINNKYRIVFYWGILGPEEVIIIDYH